MKKTFRKVLASLLVAVMLLTVAPLTGIADFDWDNLFVVKANAEDSLASAGQCGESVYWTFDESTGLLTISGMGDMYDYYYSNRSPFDSNTSIKSIVIENGVTSIGNEAFPGCIGLTSVTISDSVTSIGECAFHECASLTNVTIPDSVTSIGVAAFKYCFGLISVANCSNVTYIEDQTFEYCDSLTSITIPDSVTSIGDYAFFHCSSLTSITIPDSVTSIDIYAFSYCTGLTNITIPDSLIRIGNSAFAKCDNLTSVNISDMAVWCNIQFADFDSNPLHYAHTLYLNDEIVTDLVIPDNVTSIDNALLFYNCSSLTSVTIPDSVTSIGRSVFYNCTGLKEITMPCSTKTYNYDSYDATFYNCSNIEKVILTAGAGTMQNYSTSTGGEDTYYQYTPWYISKSDVEVIIEDGVTSIGDYAFYDSTGLTTLTIPASVEKIGNKAIAECDNLQTVVFESEEYIEMDSSVFLNSPNVTILCKENSYMHYYADMEGLKYCIIDDSNNPNFTVKNDTLVSYNGEAENIFLSSASKIGFGAFAGNTTIKSVELANNVTRIYNSAFKNCSNLEKIIIPKSVASIGDSAFTGCDSLTIWCYAGSYAEAYAVNHEIPVEYITLNLSNSRIVVADSEEITLDASFSTSMVDSVEIIWTSSNPEIATVENGVVNVVDVGEAEITATTASGLSAACEIKVDLKLDSAADAVIDNESGIVFGSDMVNKDANGIKDLFVNSRISVTASDNTAGTGSKVALLKADGTVYREVEVVIFGDVNGDGIYDGTDSIIVNCLANGLLSKEQVGEAVYMAADCNHDGVIDSADVALLEQAGIILTSVDQTKSEAELMTDSAYVEYLSLIDQSPAEEVISEKITTSDEQTSNEDTSIDSTTTETQSSEKNTDTTADKSVNQSLIQKIIAFIMDFVSIIKNIFVYLK